MGAREPRGGGEGCETWRQEEDYIHEIGTSKLLLAGLIGKPELLEEEGGPHNS